jgi:hypothetical protein
VVDLGLIMDEMIRCTACRGSKKVAKLGGIVGDCSTCKGSGKIKAIDKPVISVPVVVDDVGDVISAVDKFVVDVVKPEQIEEIKPKIHTTGKRTVYKRKSG